MFLEQRKGCMYALKIVATVVSVGQKDTLFEKRVDLTDYLVGKSSSGGKGQEQNIMAQIKQQETTGSAKPIQISLKLENLAGKKTEKNQVEEGRRINKMDIVRFEDTDEGGMVTKLINCQHASHLHEIF